MKDKRYKALETAAVAFILTIVGATVVSVLLGVYALANWVF